MVTNNISFLSVFFPFGDFFATFIKFEIVVCKLFQFRSRVLTTPIQTMFENIVGKEVNYGKQHFLPFSPQ